MAQIHDIGIDLGTSQVLICARDRGIVLREPAVVAVDRNTGKVLAVGSDAYNLKLSEERAEVVRQALIEKGIAETRLTAKGYGSEKPLYPNDNEVHKAMNRRTEMIIL